MALKISKNYMTSNDCYKTGQKIKPIGVMVHSDACKAGLKAEDWYSRWNKPGIEACVHAFLDDEKCIEYLPTEVGNCHRAWHGGGASNNTHIGFEMCEPKDYADKVYFDKIYKNAVEYTAQLLKKHGITVVNDTTVLCHSEGYKKGIATNHADVMHWFKYHNKTMDNFRNDVKAILSGITVTPSTPQQTPSISTSANYTVKITTDVLNVRKGPGTNYAVVTTVKKGEVYTIVGEDSGWGKLKSGAGWISLAYTSKGTTTSTPASNKQYLNLKPHVSSWRVYPINVAPILPNACGSLAPKTYGGLSYEILAKPQADVYTIKTSSFGTVNIYAPKDNDSVVSTSPLY